jgi:hypothetical protein
MDWINLARDREQWRALGAFGFLYGRKYLD